MYVLEKIWHSHISYGFLARDGVVGKTYYGVL